MAHDKAVGAVPEPNSRGRLRMVRAELRLARDPSLPLAVGVLDPDPLEGFATAMAEASEAFDESVEVHLDLVPVTSARARWLRRRAFRAAERRDSGGWREWIDAAVPGSQRRRAVRRDRGGLAGAEARQVDRARAEKVLTRQPLFEARVSCLARSRCPGRPEVLLRGVIAAFDQFAGENYWRVAGVNLGPVHLGVDRVPWWRWRFDRRVRSGWFGSGRGSVVSVDEIAGLFKPATGRVVAGNVVRSGGSVPPAPRTLPRYLSPVATPNVIPLGWVRRAGEWSPVGVWARDTLFQLVVGRSGYGKSERAEAQFIHLVLAGHGGLFLDPHADALERMKPYLGSVAGRVLEIDLSIRAGERRRRQAGWNLVSMTGFGPADIEARVAAVVDGFASALGWTDFNTRAKTLTQMAAQSLCELNLLLPADSQATVFQMVSILADERWRAAVVPYLSAQTQSFWVTRFDKLAGAVTPVTNLLDRLRSSTAAAALFGSSESTYDVRRAMDAGRVVLVCPAGTGDKDRLVACFVVHDVLRAALSRKDLPPAGRRPFWVFADELQELDRVGIVAQLLEQSRKFGARFYGTAQVITRLSDATRSAWLANRSHLLSLASGFDTARLIAQEWGGAASATAVATLPRYQAIASVTLDGEITPPFQVRGFNVDDLYADRRDPTAPAIIEAAVDDNLRRRPVAETLRDLDTLDERIVTWLAARPPSPRSADRLGELVASPPVVKPSESGG